MSSYLFVLSYVSKLRYKDSLHKHIKPSWCDFARVIKALNQKHMEVYLQLTPTDSRNEIIGQKQLNFYKESSGKTDFKVKMYPI